jgi:prephenate dehydratase
MGDHLTVVRLAYLGPPGTFSEEAASLYLPAAGVKLLPFQSIPAVVSAVETGIAQEGLVPVENSLEGSVGVTLDILIRESTLLIKRELVLPIRHFLLSRQGVEIAEVSVLYSHPQALGQCRRFIDRCLPDVETVAALSTATAVVQMLACPEPAAAVATLRAAEIYGAQILASDIHDQSSNQTRFAVLARTDHPPTGDDKTSICFDLKSNTPGALLAVLREFSDEGINLEKVESRPTKESLGEYVFLVDIAGHRVDPHISGVLRRIEEVVGRLRIMGSYPRYQVR